MGKEVGQVLGEISEDEHAHGRPMLSALAVSSVTGQPGVGFLGLAKTLGLLQDDSPEGQAKFWKQTREKVSQTWERQLT